MRVRVVVSFNGMHKGDTGRAEPVPYVLGLIEGGYLERIDDGETETGSGGPAPGDPSGKPA